MDEKIEIKLKELQLAQKSAEHHDSLVWTSSSIFTASALIMLGTVVSEFNKIPELILVMVCLIGFLICVFNCYLIKDFGMIKKDRYEKCKEIENYLNFKLMLNGEEKIALHSEKTKRMGGQKTLYFSFLAILMFIWIMLIFIKLCCRF
jgi:hypothetical protein